MISLLQPNIPQTITIPDNFYGNVCEFKLQVSGGCESRTTLLLLLLKTLILNSRFHWASRSFRFFVDYQLSTGKVNISTTVGGKVVCPDSGNENF